MRRKSHATCNVSHAIWKNGWKEATAVILYTHCVSLRNTGTATDSQNPLRAHNLKNKTAAYILYQLVVLLRERALAPSAVDSVVI